MISTLSVFWGKQSGAQTSTDFDGVDITDVGRGLGIKMGRLATVCEDGHENTGRYRDTGVLLTGFPPRQRLWVVR